MQIILLGGEHCGHCAEVSVREEEFTYKGNRFRLEYVVTTRSLKHPDYKLSTPIGVPKDWTADILREALEDEEVQEIVRSNAQFRYHKDN